VRIRPYAPADEPALRDICFATGFLGAPVPGWLDVNRALFTDVWLLYYLTQEPQHTFVAEVDGRVAGYLTGCADTARRQRFMRTVFPLHFLRSCLNGTYRFGPRTLRVLLRALRDRLTVGFPSVPWRRWPAHAHYNMRAEYRGLAARTGLALMQTCARVFLDRGITRAHGLVVMSKEEVGRRYRNLAAVHDCRRTTLFQGADPRELFLVSLVADFSGRSSHRYWQKFDGAHPSAT